MRNATYLQTALALRESGIATIPIAADKKPPEGMGWKRFQHRRQTVDDLARMFQRPGITGLAMLCGEASANTCVRDFDEPGAYERWADAHPYLAAECPRAMAKRGPHIYFRASTPTRTITYEDGELRGSGGYVLLPPSLHPEGGEYIWLAGEPPDFSALPIVDPHFFGKKKVRVSEAEFAGSEIPPLETLNILCDNNGPWTWNLPNGPRQRHNCIFGLVQRVKFLPGNSQRKPDEFRQQFRQWFELALPYIRTRDWGANWRDFRAIWRDCRCAGSLEYAAARAVRLPKMVVDKPRVDAVCRLCRALADMTGGHFFLSCRDAGHFAGVTDPQQGRRLLASLERMGQIVLTKRGTRGTRGRANEWRWNASP